MTVRHALQKLRPQTAAGHTAHDAHITASAPASPLHCDDQTDPTAGHPR